MRCTASNYCCECEFGQSSGQCKSFGVNQSLLFHAHTDVLRVINVRLMVIVVRNVHKVFNRLDHVLKEDVDRIKVVSRGTFVVEETSSRKDVHDCYKNIYLPSGRLLLDYR